MQYILASEEIMEISFRKGMQYIFPWVARTTNHVQSGNNPTMNHLVIVLKLACAAQVQVQ